MLNKTALTGAELIILPAEEEAVHVHHRDQVKLVRVSDARQRGIGAVGGDELLDKIDHAHRRDPLAAVVAAVHDEGRPRLGPVAGQDADPAHLVAFVRGTCG